MMRRPLPRSAASRLALLTASTVPVFVASIFPHGATAQVSELAAEVGTSRVAPPTGVEGETAQYYVAGLRFTRFAPTGSGVNASFLFGRAADAMNGGDYLSGSVDAALWGEVGRGWHLGVESHGFAFEVEEPFGYRALALEGGPALQYRARLFSGTLRGVAGIGRSRTQVWAETTSQTERHRWHARQTEQLVTFEEDLWRWGSEGELLVGNPTVAVGVAGGTHRTPAGWYSSVGARLLTGRGGGALEVRVDYWDTPVGSRMTGGLSFVAPFGGWRLRGFFGRSEPDPLTLTEPGNGAGGVLLSRRLLGGSPPAVGKEPLYRVTEAGTSPATVTIEVEAPEGAQSVAVLGDFTLWEPVAMRRSGDRWQISLQAEVGIHHFGFLVDGAWYLPPDAPDAVPDEWGRRSATMLIEGAGPQ